MIINKPMKIMLLCVGILFGSIFIYKFIMHRLIASFIANHKDIVTVSAMKVDYADWLPSISASGSLRAVRGVNVTTELAGMVRSIEFTPGAMVTQGTLLVELNASTERAQLAALEASAKLAEITYRRDKAQYAAQAVSKQTLDNDLANLESLQAQVAEQAATIAKKMIRAPFTGRLGINNVNPGQYLNPGDAIVSLQTLDPIYADFYVPQQALASLRVGQAVAVTTDTFKNKHYTGKVTTINPAVEVDTRNVKVEATISNPHGELAPGMFVTVEAITAKAQRFLTLPQTAISFNAYGNLVYVLRETQDKQGEKILVAKQVFVSTGRTRGDQIAILAGLKAGDTVVTSGQLKLKNGSQVKINQSIVPSNQAAPVAPNDH